MVDETTEHILFRTGLEDRLIPLFLGAILALTLPVWPWVSGPFFWPWGLGALVVAALGSAWGFARWKSALRTVVWEGSSGRITFCRGRKIRTLALDDLTSVTVVPSASRTRLAAGNQVWILSHRFVRVDLLLDRIRARRPDLFPVPGAEAVFRGSPADFFFVGSLAVGAAAAGFLVFPWGPWAGGAFGAGALGILVRALLFVPRSFRVSAGILTVSYLARKKTWGRAAAVREDAYAAGGAVFFRMRLKYGNRWVTLDEGHLVDSLAPWAGWIVRQLAF